MKKFYLSFCFSLFISIALSQTKHTITASGMTFNPDSLVVNVGDTVEFNVGPTHPTVQVDKSTWNSNGTSPMSGGFSYQNGTGSFVVGQAQVYYYVCQNHVVSAGMKGQIHTNTIGTEERTLQDISVYPNPVNDLLKLDLQHDPDLENVRIINLMGETVKSLELSEGSTQNFDVQDLAPGSYFLIAIHGNTSKQVRFVKE